LTKNEYSLEMKSMFCLCLGIALCRFVNCNVVFHLRSYRHADVWENRKGWRNTD